MCSAICMVWTASDEEGRLAVGCADASVVCSRPLQDLSGVKSLAELSSGKHGWNIKEYGSDFNRCGARRL